MPSRSKALSALSVLPANSSYFSMLNRYAWYERLSYEYRGPVGIIGDFHGCKRIRIGQRIRTGHIRGDEFRNAPGRV